MEICRLNISEAGITSFLHMVSSYHCFFIESCMFGFVGGVCIEFIVFSNMFHYLYVIMYLYVFSFNIEIIQLSVLVVFVFQSTDITKSKWLCL